MSQIVGADGETVKVLENSSCSNAFAEQFAHHDQGRKPFLPRGGGPPPRLQAVLAEIARQPALASRRSTHEGP